MRIYLIAGLAAIFFLASCEGPDPGSEELKFGQLAGVYHANFGSRVQDELQLFSDSTYLHTYISSKGDTSVDRGNFRFADLGRQRYRLRVDRFAVLLPPEDCCIGERKVSAGEIDTVRLAMRIRKSDKRIVLEYCPHELKYYVKAL